MFHFQVYYLFIFFFFCKFILYFSSCFVLFNVHKDATFVSKIYRERKESVRFFFLKRNSDDIFFLKKKSYARCNKIILTAGQSPKLCSTCAAAVGTKCFCCCKDEGKFDANLCKNCAPKKGLCGRCADPLKGSMIAGKLCSNCGLGSRGMNCSRLTFGANI